MLEPPQPPASNSPFVHLFFASILQEYFNTTYIRCTTQISSDNYIKSTIPTYTTTAHQSFETTAIGKWDKCLGIIIHHTEHPDIILERYERFIRMYAQNSFHRRRYLVHFRAHQEAQFERIFNFAGLRFIKDLLIVKETQSGEEVELYTHRFTRDGRVSMGRWNVTHGFPSINLYPDKMRDLEGRKFIVGMGPFIPLSHPDTLKGVESNKLKTFAKIYNLTLVIDKSEAYVGEIYSNWTGSGFMGLIMQDKLDLISYGIYLQHWRTKYGDHSYPTSTMRMTCLVPQPKMIDIWQIIHIFTYDTWLLMFLMCILSAKIFEVQKTVKNSPYEVVLKILLGQGNNASSLTRKRLLAGVLLSCIIIIHTFFGSKLASFLILPEYTDNIRSLEDLSDSKLNWYSKFSQKADALKFAQNDPQKTLYQRFRPATNELLAEMIQRKQKFAYAIDLSIKSGFYNVDEFFTLDVLQKFKLMRAALIPRQYTVFFLRKHSFYTLPMQICQRRLYEGGFAMYWEKFAVTTGPEFVLQAHLNKKDDSIGIQKLHMGQLIGTFIILIVGVVVSMVAFIAELIYYRKRDSRREIPTQIKTQIDRSVLDH